MFILVFLFLQAFTYPVNAQNSGVDQTIVLKNGFNFVSFTVTPPASPSDLKSKDTNIEDIYLYSAAAGSFLSLSEGTLTSLSVGKGYIIKSKADASITINGPPASSIGDITLKKGFNLLGFSKLSSSAKVNAFTGLMNSSSAIYGIYKWSPAAGSFIQVVRDSDGNITMLDGGDPSLKPGEAYFINVSEDTKINYDEDVKLSKIFTGLYSVPSSDTVAANGTYDLNGLKVYAQYSDGSTVEVASSSTFAASVGKINARIYSAPKYSTTAVITISYTDPASNLTKECYFTLAVTNSGSTPVKTTTYRCSYKLGPNSKVIDEESITTYSAGTNQVILNVNNQSDAPKAGDILIGYYGDGYLRKATAVSSQNGMVYVSTVQANLEDAFEMLDYSYKGKLSTLHASDSSAPGSVESKAVAKFLRSKSVMPSPAPDRSIISKDKLKKILDHASLSVSLTKAEISFDPTLECDIEISWFKLKRFLFAIGGSLNCGIEFQIDATIASDLPLKSELELFHSQPYVFAVGPVPFSFEWDITCGIDASASVTGTYSYSNDWAFAVRTGALYDGISWSKINDIKRTSNATDNYELKGAIEIKPYLNVGFALKIVGLAGPKMYLEVFLSFLAEMTSSEKVDISVSAGVGAQVSFVVELLSWTLAEFKTELFSLSWTIYSRSIDFYVAAPAITPSGGNYSDDQTITITCASEGATIRYTLDSSDPSPTHGAIYSAPFKLSSSATVKAIACKGEKVFSNVTSADYAIRDVFISSATPKSDEIVYHCTTHVGDELCPETCNADVNAQVYPGPDTTSFTVPCTGLFLYNKERKIRNCYIYEGAGSKFEGVRISLGIQAVYVENNYVKKVALPSGLVTFSCKGCYKLSSVVLPSDMTVIPSESLSGCPELTSIAIPASVKTIKSKAFAGSHLTEISLPSVVTIESEALYGCKLKKVTIGASINTIDSRAFSGGIIPDLYFEGNAPSSYQGIKDLFLATIYYKSGMQGWSALIKDINENYPNNQLKFATY